MHAYIYGMNILVDLSYWIMYEVIILSESMDLRKVLIHLSIYCDSHDSRWMQMFSRQQAWPVLR